MARFDNGPNRSGHQVWGEKLGGRTYCARLLFQADDKFNTALASPAFSGESQFQIWGDNHHFGHSEGGNVRMEFLRLSGQVVGDIAWPRPTSTSNELKQHAKAALSSFYVANRTCFWPRKPHAPGQVRIVDDNGKAAVTYTINDLMFDTGRSLLREEPQPDHFGGV